MTNFSEQLGLLLPKHYVEYRVQECLSLDKFEDAAVGICKFDLASKFNIGDIAFVLLTTNRTKNALQLLEKSPGLVDSMIKSLSTKVSYKFAISVLTHFKLEQKDYPALNEFASRAAGYYFVSQVFKDESSSDFMPWHKVADIFTGNLLLLSMLVEQILQKKGEDEKWMRIACHIYHSNDLGNTRFTSGSMRG